MRNLPDRPMNLGLLLKNFWQIVLHWLTKLSSKTAIKSGEFVTQYTLEAEKLTEFYTGIPFKTKITQAEKNLMADSDFHPLMERKVFALNKKKALSLLDSIIRFKTTILNEVLNCKMFTLNYPLLIDHILREAKLYRRLNSKASSKGIY